MPDLTNTHVASVSDVECAGVPCPCILLALCACHRRYNLYFTSFFPERRYKYKYLYSASLETFCQFLSDARLPILR